MSMPSEMVLRAIAMKAARSLASRVTSVCFASSRSASTMALLSWVRSFPADSGLMIGDMDLDFLCRIGATGGDYTALSRNCRPEEAVQNVTYFGQECLVLE